ncbi:MAG: ATP-binding protein [Oscillospiraceae bacterium]|jgi:anti-sigma regulatory factor (Ser/Thr protein kinase)|nr:ATP-binding protein [Oscillospiraceae bacterium]
MIKGNNTMTVPALVENLNDVLDFIDEKMEEIGIGAKSQYSIRVSVEELFVNIAHYAYPNGEGDVTITISTKPGEFIVEIKDSGIPYNPLEKADPDISLSIDKRKIGGLGIYMVKNMMDSVNYTYQNGQNIMTIMKKA